MRDPRAEWGSDAIADLLRETGIPYIALNPGSSYRGLHDSLVNHLGNERPEVVLCLHEEHAVAIAHGYAKVTGEPMLVALHSNVGLMHATMAIYNAFADRVPMLILGATGPWDAAQRRPWIDWLHTAADQAALVRPYIKWDDQPGSVQAALESIARASMLTRAYPHAPVYVCLDAGMQEQALDPDAPPLAPDLARHPPPAPPAPDDAAVRRVHDALRDAERPVILVGRGRRDHGSWAKRIALAEHLDAGVITDLRVGSMFPTDHPLHVGDPAYFPTAEAISAVADADVVLALDWIDLAGILQQASGAGPARALVVSCSSDLVLHNGWSKDHGGLAPVDLALQAHPDLLVEALLDRLGQVHNGHLEIADAAEGPSADSELSILGLAKTLRGAVQARRPTLVRVPLGWPTGTWPFTDPLDCLGLDGGGGIGSGPGMAVGAALALRNSDRLPVAVLGDGDLLMGATALWTAARLQLPLLVVVANNGTYLNDEVHQKRVALTRGRPIENRWIGQRIDRPRPQLAELGASLGLTAFGPVSDADSLSSTLADGVAASTRGPVIVDVHLPVEDYGVGEAGSGAARSVRATIRARASRRLGGPRDPHAD
jgi:thiamine pyrophosphate-dependent acetolactate synthase large subunit-like protein